MAKYDDKPKKRKPSKRGGAVQLSEEEILANIIATQKAEQEKADAAGQGRQLGGVQDQSYGGIIDRMPERSGSQTLSRQRKRKGQRVGGGLFDFLKRGEPHAGGLAKGKGGGTGRGGSGTGGTKKGTDVSGATSSQVSMPSSLEMGNADRDAWQRMYDYYRNKEDLPEFQTDETYAPDSEGYRDVGGYLMDIGKTAMGAFGATKELDPYRASSDFNQMISESRRRRDMGMSAETRSGMMDMADRAYNYDVKNIRGMAGGSGGTALANLGGASDRYYQAEAQMGMMDEQIKGQNRAQYYNAALQGEQVNRMQWQDQRDIDMMDKQAGGMLMADALDNIGQRKEYEDTYKKPGSPYYEYMKELTLDTRQNKDLAKFSNELMLHNLEQEELDAQNQAQEKIAEIDRLTDLSKEEWRKSVKAEGLAPEIETAQDFKEYNGEPVVSIDSGIDETKLLSGLTGERGEQLSQVSESRNTVKPDFGYSENDMDKMDDTQLSAEGIERTTTTVMKKDKSGTKVPVTYINADGDEVPQTTTSYSKSTVIEDAPDNVLDMSASEDTIRKEYSKRKQALMDELYLTNEKKYNKELKKLEAEEKEAIKMAKEKK